jgi:cell division protein FtsB
MKKVNEESFLILRDELLKQIQQRDSQILSLQSKEKELKDEIARLTKELDKANEYVKRQSRNSFQMGD